MPLPKPIVQIEQFEGPYDLLLDLVQTEKLDISELSLASVTDSFLQAIKSGVQPEVMADFLVVAATLLLLKIRSALPTLELEEEEEITQLTDRVRIYQLYRERAGWLQSLWGNYNLFPANFWAPDTAPTRSLPDISLLDLSVYYEGLLSRVPAPKHPTAHLIVHGRTLHESLSLFTQRLTQAKQFLFQEAVQEDTPQDKAVAFLAVLEMARQQAATLHQRKHFDTIMVEKI